MYMQTPQNEHNIEDQNEYLYSLERWFFIFDSLLLSEGSDLTALLSLHWNYVMGTYALCQDTPAYECLIETCFLSLGLAIIICLLFSPLSMKKLWIPVNRNHFTIHNCFRSDLYIMGSVQRGHFSSHMNAVSCLG